MYAILSWHYTISSDIIVGSHVIPLPQSGIVGKSNAKKKGGRAKKKSSTAEDHGGDTGGGDDAERGSEEFVEEISGVVDWCTRVVVPALSESFVKG